jgi:hypothetical protein
MVAPGGIFVFRSSPGNLGGNYGYAILTSKKSSFELHNGIEVIGHSGMQHEADILLLSNASHPVTAQSTPTPLSLTIECKLYASASRLKGEARKAVGMVTDWAERSHPSKQSLHQQGSLHCGKAFEAIFVTSVRAGLRKDIEAFLATYDVTPCFGAQPGAGGMRSLQGTLSSVFRGLR